MPTRESHSSASNGQPQDVSSGTIKPATDQSATENACRLIDGYVLAVWQEPPPSPASQHDAVASTRPVDPGASTMARNRNMSAGRESVDAGKQTGQPHETLRGQTDIDGLDSFVPLP
jgi:hypothetical protein